MSQKRSRRSGALPVPAQPSQATPLSKLGWAVGSESRLLGGGAGARAPRTGGPGSGRCRARCCCKCAWARSVCHRGCLGRRRPPEHQAAAPPPSRPCAAAPPSATLSIGDMAGCKTNGPGRTRTAVLQPDPRVALRTCRAPRATRLAVAGGGGPVDGRRRVRRRALSRHLCHQRLRSALCQALAGRLHSSGSRCRMRLTYRLGDCRRSSYPGR